MFAFRSPSGGANDDDAVTRAEGCGERRGGGLSKIEARGSKLEGRELIQLMVPRLVSRLQLVLPSMDAFSKVMSSDNDSH